MYNFFYIEYKMLSSNYILISFVNTFILISITFFFSFLLIGLLTIFIISGVFVVLHRSFIGAITLKPRSYNDSQTFIRFTRSQMHYFNSRTTHEYFCSQIFKIFILKHLFFLGKQLKVFVFGLTTSY